MRLHKCSVCGMAPKLYGNRSTYSDCTKSYTDITKFIKCDVCKIQTSRHKDWDTAAKEWNEKFSDLPEQEKDEARHRRKDFAVAALGSLDGYEGGSPQSISKAAFEIAEAMEEEFQKFISNNG